MRAAVKDILLDNGITTDINAIASRIIELLKVHQIRRRRRRIMSMGQFLKILS
jgi:hypothetical protein